VTRRQEGRTNVDLFSKDTVRIGEFVGKVLESGRGEGIVWGSHELRKARSSTYFSRAKEERFLRKSVS